MSSGSQSHSSSNLMFTVLNGPMKGASRVMQGPEFTMGRSPEADFVIVNDPRVSRMHAQINAGGGGFELISLNEKNPALVNGRPVVRQRIRQGDVLTIGATELRCGSPNARAAGGAAALGPGAGGGRGFTANYDGGPGGGGYGDGPAPRAPRASGGGTFPTRFVIYGVVAVVLYLIFGTDSVVKKKTTQIRTEQIINADIDAANKLRELSEDSKFLKTEQSITLRQAQENYVRGFRDFRKAQYERALISFQACLALNPEHVLCNRYQRLTQRKFDELIQYEIVLGRKYRDQNQFQACRASFRNVMVMVKDANSKTFQEAKANYDACNSLMEGRY